MQEFVVFYLVLSASICTVDLVALKVQTANHPSPHPVGLSVRSTNSCTLYQPKSMHCTTYFLLQLSCRYVQMNAGNDTSVITFAHYRWSECTCSTGGERVVY
jgi:hypothetical protein